MSFRQHVFCRAVCDKCGDVDDGSEFQWWFDEQQAVEDVTENADWFERTRIKETIPASDDYPVERHILETVELICRECQACDVCGTKPAYVGDDDSHLVCEGHEDYEFGGDPS